MQEAFLHYLWKYKKLDVLNLYTTNGEHVKIVNTGTLNHNAGPDFFNSQLNIGDQLWVGNVEMHLKSSDWYTHKHQTDNSYDNVILHVVWNHDVEVFRKDQSIIPTLVLKDFVAPNLLENYYKLFDKKQQWINCQNDLADVDVFLMNNWLERLYFDRLEKKASEWETLLEQSNNNWEAVLFKLLAKNFGLKVNGESFLSLANSIEFNVVRKCQNDQQQLEALFFGQAGLLETRAEDVYYHSLQTDYEFLRNKFQLEQVGVLPIQFFRLRPQNFPTIRLSQLAMLYYKEHKLFSKIIAAKSKKELYKLLRVSVSDYWQTHYNFNAKSKSSKSKLTNSFVDLLLINTIIPLKFTYAKQKGKSIDAELIDLISSIAYEKNSIVEKYNSFKPIANNALRSQGLLQLKTNYCDKNKCLQCAIGNALLSEN